MGKQRGVRERGARMTASSATIAALSGVLAIAFLAAAVTATSRPETERATVQDAPEVTASAGPEAELEAAPEASGSAVSDAPRWDGRATVAVTVVGEGLPLDEGCWIPINERWRFAVGDGVDAYQGRVVDRWTITDSSWDGSVCTLTSEHQLHVRSTFTISGDGFRSTSLGFYDANYSVPISDTDLAGARNGVRAEVLITTDGRREPRSTVTIVQP